LFEASLFCKTRVRNAIQRYAAGEAQSLEACLFVNPTRVLEQSFFSFQLQARSEVSQQLALVIRRGRVSTPLLDARFESGAFWRTQSIESSQVFRTRLLKKHS